MNDLRERKGSGLCGCCLNLFKLIISLGFSALIWWLIFRPHDIKIYINAAELSQFNLTGAGAASNSSALLRYNLTFDLSVRNPNGRIGVYYDLVEATAFYGDRLLESTELPAFFQHRKNTTRLRPAFDGQAKDVGPATAAAFRGEEREGSFNLDVKLHARVRFKVWFVKFGHFKRDFDCMAKNIPVPASASNSSSVAFPAGTECDR